MADDDIVILSGKEELRMKIRYLAAPWMSTGNEPPYSANELLAMALLSNDAPLTEEDIFIWIRERFGYYEKLHHAHLYRAVNSVQCRARLAFRDRIRDALTSYEYPVETVEVDDEYRFTMSAANGMTVLANVITGTSAKHLSSFPLFDLPPELRARIFEMVLQYPKSGISLSFAVLPGRAKRIVGDRLHVASRELKDNVVHAERTSGPERSLSTARIPEILSLFTVNRQIYNEAMPIFYSVNRFCCPSLSNLCRFVSGLHHTRRRHVKQMAVVYRVDQDDVIANRAFRLLGRLQNLSVLDICIDEQDWVPRQSSALLGQQVYSRLDIPGLHALRSVRANQVNFEGCPAIESNLKMSMTRSKTDQEALRSGTKKRKASVIVLDDDEEEPQAISQIKKSRRI